MCIYDIFSNPFWKKQMSQFLTTRELAAMLRVKERKVYELAAEGALPVRRVTGKLLFPRVEIEEWIVTNGGLTKPGKGARATAPILPAVIAGGHDPLLEWALRESRSGIAAFLDGALDGLRRAAENDCIAAGLHIPERGKDAWNVGAVSESFGDKPVVLIEWAKRTRGLMYRTEPGRSIDSLAATRGLRFQSRQPEAGSELVLAQLLGQEGLRKSDLHCVDAVERSEMDLGMAIAAGKADVGLGIEASARQFQLEFTALIVERFDLLIWRKAYFDPPFQKLIRFCASEPFERRAQEFGGYDIGGFGTVHFNGP
jgi:excisionase family DNA binding protein